MLSDFSFTIVTHRFIPTLADDLKTFLKKNKCEVTFIAHEFADLPTRRSFIETSKITYSPDFRFLPEILIYFKDLFYSIWWLITKVRRTDVYVGYGAFNMLPGIFLKDILGVKKTVFYTVDFVPNRFGSVWLNNFYKIVDAFAVRNSSETWNLSPRMQSARKNIWHLSGPDYSRQKWVPLGVWKKPRITPPVLSKTIFFSGHILEKQGIQKVIESLPRILKSNPAVKLVVVGMGGYLQTLKDLVRSMGLQKQVEFKGKTDTLSQDRIMAKSAVAVATYDPSNAQYSAYADSAKLKTYLSAGLPIVLTNVTYNAHEIEKNKCGKVVEYSSLEIAKAISLIISNSKLQLQMKQHAFDYIKQFDWDVILSKNFKRLLYAN